MSDHCVNVPRVPRQVCEEQVRLSQVVAKAVQAVYVAKTKHDQAVKDGRDSTLSMVALGEARKTERETVAALEAHRKEHKC